MALVVFTMAGSTPSGRVVLHDVSSGRNVLESFHNGGVDALAHGLDLLSRAQLKQLTLLHGANEVLQGGLPLHGLHQLPGQQAPDLIWTLHGPASHI